MAVCDQCSKVLNSSREWCRFCSTTCRVRAFRASKRGNSEEKFIRELQNAIIEIRKGRLYIASGIVRNALIDFEANPENVSRDEMISFVSNYK